MLVFVFLEHLHYSSSLHGSVLVSSGALFSPEAPPPCTLTHLNLIFLLWLQKILRVSDSLMLTLILCFWGVLGMLGLHFEDGQELWAPLLPSLPPWIPWPSFIQKWELKGFGFEED